jgi:hypothetical protein
MAMTDPASPRQHGFMTTLLRERAVPAEVKTMMEAAASREDFTKAMASAFIDELMKLPKITASGPVTVTTGGSTLWERLRALPKAKYAVEIDGVLTFAEVKEWKGRTYMRKLLGSPGDFSRVKLNTGQIARLVDAIEPNPLAATQRFGDEFTCCSVCLAPLTDEVSRSHRMGPTCRGRFGL